MAGFAYRYELRRGDEVIAMTGRLTRERALEVGERIEIGAQLGIVRSIEPVLSEPELHLVVQLLRRGRRRIAAHTRGTEHGTNLHGKPSRQRSSERNRPAPQRSMLQPPQHQRRSGYSLSGHSTVDGNGEVGNLIVEAFQELVDDRLDHRFLVAFA